MRTLSNARAGNKRRRARVGYFSGLYTCSFKVIDFCFGCFNFGHHLSRKIDPGHFSQTPAVMS